MLHLMQVVPILELVLQLLLQSTSVQKFLLNHLSRLAAFCCHSQRQLVEVLKEVQRAC